MPAAGPAEYPGMTEIDIAAPFPEAGGKVTFTAKSAGLSMTITETVLDYQPDRLQLMQMEGMLSGRAPGSSRRKAMGRAFDDAGLRASGDVLARSAMSHRQRMNAKNLEGGLQQLGGVRRIIPMTS